MNNNKSMMNYSCKGNSFNIYPKTSGILEEIHNRNLHIQ